jgi:predicted nucleic acid-binding protein
MPTATERIQEVIQATANGRPKVALDTNCVQYYISNPPVQPFADCLDPIFQAGVEGRIELYVSTVVVSELLAHMHFSYRHQAGYDPELDLLAIINRHFQILDVNDGVARAAGRLRGNYLPADKITLKTPDALIGATSLANGHALFITNDFQLAGALPPTNCIYLKDVGLEWLAQHFPGTCFGGTGPVLPSRRGRGFPSGVSMATMELGGIRPDPSAKWRRILKDAQTVASAVVEPCAFFVLSARILQDRAQEIPFWHASPTGSRPPEDSKRLHEHRLFPGQGCKPRSRSSFIRLVCSREGTARSSQFRLKGDHQKSGCLNATALANLPGISSCRKSWLLCEDGVTHLLTSRIRLGF